MNEWINEWTQNHIQQRACINTVSILCTKG